MRLVWLVIVILLFAGCQTKPPAADTSDVKNAPLAAHGAGEGTSPPTTTNMIKGKVLERLDAGRYSYLRLSTSSGEIWAAVPQTPVETGTEVSIANPSPMDGFESETLKRKFDKIVFGALGEQPLQPDQLQALRKAHAEAANPVNTGSTNVPKASGSDARTIAEIFAQKDKLKDQIVLLRGKVVKVNSNIMGKTWIHLRDGTGSRESKTDDITLTTQGSAAVGDIVLANGIVRVNKDFGMGYVFSVIIEDATVTQQPAGP